MIGSSCFCRSFSSNGLDKKIGLIGVLKDLETTKNVDKLVQNGVSRVRVRGRCCKTGFMAHAVLVASDS